MTEPRHPNSFQLSGDYGIEITYDESSINGQPRFTFRDANHDLSASGDQILREETSIGTLVGAALGGMPDQQTVEGSVLLPTVNLGEGDSEFDTVAIVTTTRTSIGGPSLVTGPLQSYEVHAVHGTARVLEF